MKNGARLTPANSNSLFNCIDRLPENTVRFHYLPRRAGPTQQFRGRSRQEDRGPIAQFITSQAARLSLVEGLLKVRPAEQKGPVSGVDTGPCALISLRICGRRELKTEVRFRSALAGVGRRYRLGLGINPDHAGLPSLVARARSGRGNRGFLIDPTYR